MMLSVPRRKSMRSDQSFARPHGVGASVVCVQVLEHESLGVIAYEWPRFWPDVLAGSRSARDALSDLHEHVAHAAPGHDGTRDLSYASVQPAIAAHVQMVVNAVLAIRYLVLEVERTAVLLPASGDDDLGR